MEGSAGGAPNSGDGSAGGGGDEEGSGGGVVGCGGAGGAGGAGAKGEEQLFGFCRVTLTDKAAQESGLPAGPHIFLSASAAAGRSQAVALSSARFCWEVASLEGR
ncbi:MAG: hypothetical protein J3K34DRAFT_468290 [Monoraphidium minutum]|nr:MAG: hypothetical protein J3K34DRAFT_468290 [Monoraphidium minutum]